MNVIPGLRAYADSHGIPTLVLVDMQQEYIAPPRGLSLPNVDVALMNCRAALDYARTSGFPVAFVRWMGKTPFFNPATRFVNWIEGFEPASTEMIFERSRPSCYACPHFANVIEQAGGHFVLAGFAGEAACLSTGVDAFHRSHHMTFLADASASHPLNDLSAENTHQVISRVISLYANVVETETWTATSALTSKRRRQDGCGFAGTP